MLSSEVRRKGRWISKESKNWASSIFNSDGVASVPWSCFVAVDGRCRAGRTRKQETGDATLQCRTTSLEKLNNQWY